MPPLSATTTEIVADDDSISLTSTAKSEPQDEYEVDTIHAQEYRNGVKHYLVKWKGYSDLRCTWEPAEAFNSSETLDDWRRKKRAISKGLRAPFDVEKWLAECKASDDASQDRKRRRKEKRVRLGLPDSGQDEAGVRPAKDSEDLTKSRTSFSSAPPDAKSLPTSKESRDIQPKNQIRPQNIQTTNNLPKAVSLQSTTIRPQNKASHRAEIPKAAPPKPVSLTVQGGRTERRDLSNVLNRARTQETTSTHQNKTWKLFSTANKFDKASRQDHEPNREDLELQSPKTWSPFQMSSFLRRRKSTEEDNSLFVEQDDGPDLTENVLPRSPIASKSSPTHHSQQLNRMDDNNPATSSTHHTPERRKSSLNDNSLFTSELLPPTGPRSMKPSKKKFMVGGRELHKKSDILCTVCYGPNAIEIGDTLLCDLSEFARTVVYKLKFKSEIRVRFDELYTLEQYQSLSDEINHEILFNGFIGPYPDTQAGLSQLENILLEEDLVGVARICPRLSLPDQGITFFCYPTKSKSFQFLNKYPYDVREGCLRITGRAGILPRLSQKASANSEENSSNVKKYVRPEREGRFNEDDKAEPENLIPWRLPSKSVLPSSQPKDSYLDKIRKSPLKVRTTSLDGRTQAMDVSKTPTDKQEEAEAPTSDAMDISDSPVVPANNNTDKPICESPISEDHNLLPSVDEASNEIPTNQNTEDVQDVPMLDVGTDQGIEHYIKDAFPKAFGIDFEDIAAITSRANSRPTNCFYLCFPESANGEFEILEKFFDSHCAIVLSNRKHNDWEKFTKSPSGVALFHHTFLQYHELPGLYKLISSSSFNFWNVSLSDGIPNLDTKTHFQRLFPQGTGFLMTEDFMLQEPDAAIIILAWFREMAASKFPGTAKMMFRSDILQWLDRMSEKDSRFAVMAILIGDAACQGDSLNWPVEARDLDYFMNPYLQSPVISLADMSNGLTTDGTNSVVNDDDNTAKTSRQERDADLLCEVFAAWAVLNASSLRRFHVITHIKPRERWQKWQHIEISQGATEFFQRWNINKDHYTKWLAQKNAASGSSPSSSSAVALPNESMQWNPASQKVKSPPIAQTAASPSQSRPPRQ